MKIKLLLASLLTVGVISITMAQEKPPTVYRNGIPVSNDDTVQNFPGYDFAPSKNMVVVPIKKLPKALYEALKTEDQYEGWQNLPVYFDENTKIYYIRIKTDSTLTQIGLNENGNPVKYSDRKLPDK